MTYPADQWPKWFIISSAAWKRLPEEQRGQLWAIGEFRILTSGSSQGNMSIIVTETRGQGAPAVHRTAANYARRYSRIGIRRIAGDSLDHFRQTVNIVGDIVNLTTRPNIISAGPGYDRHFDAMMVM